MARTGYSRCLPAKHYGSCSKRSCSYAAFWWLIRPLAIASYGWSTTGTTIVGVDVALLGGWPRWQEGDVGDFTYNPVRKSLTVRLARTRSQYRIALGETLRSPRNNCCCYGAGGARVRVMHHAYKHSQRFSIPVIWMRTGMR